MSEHLPVGRIVCADGVQLLSPSLDDAVYLAELLALASVRGGATVVFTHVEHFHPQGVTAFCVLAESHVVLHTYPEHASAMLDAFTCGEDASPERICSEIIAALGGEWDVQAFRRGEVTRTGHARGALFAS